MRGNGQHVRVGFPGLPLHLRQERTQVGSGRRDIAEQPARNAETVEKLPCIIPLLRIQQCAGGKNGVFVRHPPGQEVVEQIGNVQHPLRLCQLFGGFLPLHCQLVNGVEVERLNAGNPVQLLCRNRAADQLLRPSVLVSR